MRTVSMPARVHLSRGARPGKTVHTYEDVAGSGKTTLLLKRYTHTV